MGKQANEFETVYLESGQRGFVPQASDVLELFGGNLRMVRGMTSLLLVKDDLDAARDMWDELYPRIEAANAQ